MEWHKPSNLAEGELGRIGTDRFELVGNPRLHMRMAVLFRRVGPYHLARLDGAAGVARKRGWEVRGIAVSTTDSDYAWRPVRETDLDLHIVSPERPYGEVQRGQMISAIFSALDSWDPAAVAVPGYSEPYARAALAWCRLRGRTAVLMSESKEDDAPRRLLVEACKHWVVRLFDAALVGGEAHARYATQLGVPPEKVFLGYDVVDNAYFAAAAKAARQQEMRWRTDHGLDQQFVLASCRFISRKNIIGLIKAYTLYRAKVGGECAWNLIVLGSGPEESRIRETVRQLQLEGSVHLPGFRQIEELPSWYGLAAAFIHPALQEQWGLVVNEAMASGTPVAVSRRAGAAELVRQGVNGWLFDPEDVGEIAQLLASMHRLGPDRLREMGAKAADSIQEWGPHRFGQSLLDAVQAGLETRASRGWRAAAEGCLLLGMTRLIG